MAWAHASLCGSDLGNLIKSYDSSPVALITEICPPAPHIRYYPEFEWIVV